MQFKAANKINGFKPVSYGLAVESFGSHSSDAFEGHGKTLRLETQRAKAGVSV